MDTKFVEAGHGGTEETCGNWGKFLIARYTAAELAEPTQFPMCEGEQVVDLHGTGRAHVWMLDLATGEGVRFPVGVRNARDALRRHQVWVCPMFGPMLDWLIVHIRAVNRTWWNDLPRVVYLPDAPFDLVGSRGPGPDQATRHRVRDLLTGAPLARRR